MAKQKTVTSEVIKLKRVRLSFAKIFTPESFREGQPKRYEASYLLDPSDAAHAESIKEIRRAATKILIEHWKGKENIPTKGKNANVNCFGFADEDGEVYDGYEGMFYIKSSTPEKRPPRIIDRDKKELTEADGKPYSGCYVNTNITLWVQSNEFGNRVNCNLRIVQFVADGEAFGAAAASADEMDEIEFDGDLDDDEGMNDDVDDFLF